MEQLRTTTVQEEKEVNYQVQCVCGCDQFDRLPIRIQTYYDTMTYRVCKRCGTLKMGYGYYNQEKQEYGTNPIKPKKEED